MQVSQQYPSRRSWPRQRSGCPTTSPSSSATQQTTYAELWDQARGYAGALRARGVGEGTPVAMLIPNVVDFPRVYFAVLALGGIVVPIHSLLKAEEIDYVLRDSGSRLLVCAAPLLGEGAKGAALAGVDVVSVLLPEASEALPPRLEDEAAAAEPIDTYVPRDPFDTATILYTSGTTGQPKGAEGCHLALVEQVNVLLLNTFDLKAEDRVLGCLPLFHTFGQTCAMNVAFRAGATIVLVPKFTGDAALTHHERAEDHDLHGRADHVHGAAGCRHPQPRASAAALRLLGRIGHPGGRHRPLPGGLRRRDLRGLRAHRDLAGRDVQPHRRDAPRRHGRSADLGRRRRGR